MCQEQVEKALQQSGKENHTTEKDSTRCYLEWRMGMLQRDLLRSSQTRFFHWNGNSIPHDDNTRRDRSHREKMRISSKR